MPRPDNRPHRPSRALAVRIGTLVRELRNQRGMNQWSLANRIDMTQSRLSRIETGEAPPSLKGLLALAQGLGCSPEPLLPLVELEAPEDMRLQNLYRSLWLLPPQLRHVVTQMLGSLVEILGADPRRHLGRVSMGAKL